MSHRQYSLLHAKEGYLGTSSYLVAYRPQPRDKYPVYITGYYINVVLHQDLYSVVKHMATLNVYHSRHESG